MVSLGSSNCSKKLLPLLLHGKQDPLTIPLLQPKPPHTTAPLCLKYQHAEQHAVFRAPSTPVVLALSPPMELPHVGSSSLQLDLAIYVIR